MLRGNGRGGFFMEALPPMLAPRLRALTSTALFPFKGPRSHWLLGSLPDLKHDRLSFLTRCAREYGDFVRLRVGSQRWVLISHPDLVEELLVVQQPHLGKPRLLSSSNRMVFGEGLLTSDGDFWRRQRRLAQPAFHRQRVAGYGTVMSTYAERMVERWRTGDLIDAHAAMMELTLGIVAKCLFDADVDDQADDVRRSLELLVPTFMRRVNRVLPVPDWVPTPDNLRMRRAVRGLEAVIFRIIRERRASGGDTGDLLSMLLRRTRTAAR
jgi:cytochrome P450